MAGIVLTATVRLDLTGPSAAAWVQGIGSLLAVGAAIWAAIWSAGRAQRLEADRNLARARVFAFRFAPLAIRIANRIERIREYALTSNFGLNDAVGDFIVPVTRRLLIGVEVPDVMLDDAIALDSTVARNCIRLKAFVDQYDNLVMDQIPRFRVMTVDQRGEYLSAIDRSQKNILGLAAVTRDAMLKLNE